MTVHVNVELPLKAPSDAETVTLYVPDAVKGSVPVISPVVGFMLMMLSPGGRLVALKVRGSPAGSVPRIGSETVCPAAVVWGPGLVTTGAWSTTIKVTVVVVLCVPSETVMVTKYVPAAPGGGVPL